MAPSIEKPVIVLVQGSFQLPEAYYKLADALKALGYSVVQPLLPSLTDHEKPDFASKSLSDDALVVGSEVRRLVEQGKKVVLVMHSYGGLVGNEAVTKDLSFIERQSNGLSGGVVHLFYFAALILTLGQSVLDVFGESPNNDVKPHGRFTIKDPANILYHDLPPAEAKEWELKIIDQSYAVQETKVTNEAFRHVPSTFVVCEKDRGPPPVYQEKFGETAGSKIQKMSCGHSPMLSHTKDLTGMIDQAAEEDKGTHMQPPAAVSFRPDTVFPQCDFQRPSCSPCVRAGNECEGYNRGLDIVRYVKGDACRATLQPIQIPINSTPSNRAVGIQALWGNFQCRHLPSTSEAHDEGISAWLRAASKMREADRMAETASVSLCLRLLGQETGSQTMTRDGLRLYGETLGLLRHCVEDLHCCPRQRRKALLTSMLLQAADIAMFGTPQKFSIWDWRPDE
ncbi:hypothetical protein QQS21_006661 [Conoideocrella luteorostrata]|uniref:AB hydrolase-1 domain-containing protein n=1 Tax=Conoideocrella luteorostrata TaxID=1105319 RepID=A0AAJ0CMB5_9HYPO|nr:hypothetical protein QQS21_006661 [Conoideocrella luteorostrata]